MSERIAIPRIVGYHCFACGTENPFGLQMSFYREGDEICSDVVVADCFVGWENMVHGGVVSTMMDEVMAWTILYFKRAFCVTREMKARYLRPVPVGVPLTVRGKLVADGREFACRVSAKVEREPGQSLAEAQGDFALLRPEQLNLLPEKVRVEMERFLAALPFPVRSRERSQRRAKPRGTSRPGTGRKRTQGRSRPA